MSGIVLEAIATFMRHICWRCAHISDPDRCKLIRPSMTVDPPAVTNWRRLRSGAIEDFIQRTIRFPQKAQILCADMFLGTLVPNANNQILTIWKLVQCPACGVSAGLCVIVCVVRSLPHEPHCFS